MKHPTCVFLALLLTLAQTSGQSSELRTFTNASGKAIQARLVGVEGVNATIEMATGQRFTLAVTQFSAADQAYIKQAAATLAPATAAPAAATAYKPGPNDQLEPAVVNEAVGQPLFGETPLWTASATEIAEKLGINPIGEEESDVCEKGIGVACGQRQAQAPLGPIEFPLQQVEPLGRKLPPALAEALQSVAFGLEVFLLPPDHQKAQQGGEGAAAT